MDLRGCTGSDRSLTLWIQRDELDRRPVAGVARPATWVLFSGVLVHRIAAGEDVPIDTSMTLRRADVSNAAVAMLVVVPTHEVCSSLTCVLQIDEAARRKLGSILRRAKQAFHEGVVIAHARP